MSALSTILSILMLPFNLYVFTWLAYGHEIVQQINWVGLMGSILIVIAAILSGVFASAYYDCPDFSLKANRFGNAAGVALIVISTALAHFNKDYQLWERDWSFYFAVAMPCLLGLVVSTGVTTCLCLLPPERVTVAIEVCFQNVSIPIAIAVSIYDEDKLAEAIGVPVFWAISETVLISGYCVWAWQAGWTKAPADVMIWEALTTSYEVNREDHSIPESTRQLNIHALPESSRHLHILSPASPNRIPVSKSNIQNSDGDEWDYVDYGQAVEKGAHSSVTENKAAADQTVSKSDASSKAPIKMTQFGFFRPTSRCFIGEPPGEIPDPSPQLKRSMFTR